MSDERNLHEEVRSSWDALAAFWDERMRAEETWQGHLIYPAVERLLAVRSGERVLDIACGNGEFARRIAEQGARVLATDFSEGMLERARAHRGGVDYALADATDEQALLRLGEEESFDAVVSNMAIMDMEAVEPMIAAASRLLRPGGRFVFSMLHPAFNSGDARPTVELDVEKDVTEIYSVKVRSYGHVSTSRGVAVRGQPVQQWYFHRPLWAILQPFFERGFVLDGLEEPLVRPEHAAPRTPEYVYTEVPGVLVGRMSRAPGQSCPD